MNLFRKIRMLGAIAALSLASIGGVNAAPINMDGNLQNGVVFGSGNANGSFTGINANGIELALRGKLRYDLNGNPQNIFNYDGDRTYTFDPANSNAPGNRAIWNFEFSIDVTNTNVGTFANSGLQFLLGVDTDPTAAVLNAGGPFGFDPLMVFTDNAGGMGVAQNSQNLGFTGYTMLDPQLAGIYTISLTAFDGNEILTTSIDIVVESAQVSAPATLPLVTLAMLAFGVRRLRKS